MYWNFVVSRVTSTLQRLAMRLRTVGPVGLDRIPELLQPFLVGVAVLDDQAGDALRVLERQPPADGRPVVHDVHRETLDAELVEQPVDQFGEAVEGVGESGAIRHVALAEARIVRRDHAVAVGQRRDQVAEHVRGGREAVQQQHDRRVRRPGLAIEDPHAVDRGGPVMGDGNGPRIDRGRGHQDFPFGGSEGLVFTLG